MASLTTGMTKIPSIKRIFITWDQEIAVAKWYTSKNCWSRKSWNRVPPLWNTYSNGGTVATKGSLFHEIVSKVLQLRSSSNNGNWNSLSVPQTVDTARVIGAIGHLIMCSSSLLWWPHLLNGCMTAVLGHMTALSILQRMRFTNCTTWALMGHLAFQVMIRRWGALWWI